MPDSPLRAAMIPVTYGHRSRMLGLVSTVCLAASSLGACATVPIPPSDTLLGEDQIVDLLEHPRRWDGRVLTVEIYPYDNGFRESYRVCFERCDWAYADNSPVIINTQQDRFKGYRGDRPVVVTVRYASCLQRDPKGPLVSYCSDLIVIELTEIDRLPAARQSLGQGSLQTRPPPAT